MATFKENSRKRLKELEPIIQKVMDENLEDLRVELLRFMRENYKDITDCSIIGHKPFNDGDEEYFEFYAMIPHIGQYTFEGRTKDYYVEGDKYSDEEEGLTYKGFNTLKEAKDYLGDLNKNAVYENLPCSQETLSQDLEDEYGTQEIEELFGLDWKFYMRNGEATIKRYPGKFRH